LATPCIERAVPGVVVPIPRLPVSANLPASVRSPDLKVEKSKSPFPVLKFWVRSEVMAEVVVAAPYASRVLKAILNAVVVAEERLERVKGVEVAEARVEVAATAPNVGDVVAERVNVYVLPDWEVERSAYPVLLLTVEKALAQLEHDRVWVFWFHPKGEEMMAEARVLPAPARRPPKVVEAVPPLVTAMVVLAERAPVESTVRTASV